MSPWLKELDRQTKAALAEASVMRRPYGPILSSATRQVIDWEARGHLRRSEAPRFIDGLTSFVNGLASVPPKGKRP